jgi:hypothetical protein
MRKKIFVIIIISIIQFQKNGVAGQDPDLVRIREMCSAAYQKDNPEEITNELNQSEYHSPIFKGYQSIILMLQAKISNSPLEKIKYFNKGKYLLESTIAADNENVELRYLRFCVQTNVPFYLFYNDDIEKDKKYIMENWNRIQDEDLKSRIKRIMTLSSYCSRHEKIFFIDG